MSPSVEEGVNNTMVGALQLAEKVFAVLRDGSSGTMQEILEKAVKEYEEGIFVRVHGVARETLQGLGVLLPPLEFQEMIERFKAGHREVQMRYIHVFLFCLVVLYRKVSRLEK